MIFLFESRISLLYMTFCPHCWCYLFIRCQVAPERVSFESLINLLEEVIILVAFVGFLADDEGHVESSHGVLVQLAVQGVFP